MSEEQGGAPKGLLSSALLVATVGAILLTGLALRTSGRTEIPVSAPAAAAPPAPAPPLGSEIAPATGHVETPPAEAEAPVETAAPPPVLKELRTESEPSPALTSLASRAEADSARLGKARGRFTAQLLVACKPETVERVLSAAAGSPRLYVLPARVKDEACFRVCFGDYPTAKDAAAAADLPSALRGKEKIGAAEISKVLP